MLGVRLVYVGAEKAGFEPLLSKSYPTLLTLNGQRHYAVLLFRFALLLLQKVEH